MGFFNLQMIEQIDNVFDHLFAILFWVVGFSAFAVAAAIEGDDFVV